MRPPLHTQRPSLFLHVKFILHTCLFLLLLTWQKVFIRSTLGNGWLFGTVSATYGWERIVKEVEIAPHILENQKTKIRPRSGPFPGQVPGLLWAVLWAPVWFSKSGAYREPSSTNQMVQIQNHCDNNNTSTVPNSKSHVMSWTRVELCHIYHKLHVAQCCVAFEGKALNKVYY